MKARNKIKEIFSKMLSPKIELNNTEQEFEGEDIEKEIFVSMIQTWSNAWKQQNTLFNKYGIDFSGYDNLLYNSLEKAVIIMFGHTKAQIINTFVYSSLDLEEDSLKITDKNNISYFISSPEELFDFLLSIDDEDLLINDNEDNDEEG